MESYGRATSGLCFEMTRHSHCLSTLARLLRFNGASICRDIDKVVHLSIITLCPKLPFCGKIQLYVWHRMSRHCHASFPQYQMAMHAWFRATKSAPLAYATVTNVSNSKIRRILSSFGDWIGDLIDTILEVLALLQIWSYWEPLFSSPSYISHQYSKVLGMFNAPAR